MLVETRSKDMEYIITCHVPMCPHCGGALHNKSNLTIYRCNDCNSVFIVEKSGQAEHEMVCKEVFFDTDNKEDNTKEEEKAV